MPKAAEPSGRLSIHGLRTRLCPGLCASDALAVGVFDRLKVYDLVNESRQDVVPAVLQASPPFRLTASG